jgi:uncharacterized repeat protein (TIGR04076 family)
MKERAMPPAKVKITVLKKLHTDEVLKQFGNNVEAECGLFPVGKEFVSEGVNMPAGFCSWAWADIQRDVAHLALGGDFPWINKKGTMVSSCTDGLRPVLFKLERI